jgi:fatty acid synthase, animal type
MLPENFKTDPPDRKRYLTWARELIQTNRIPGALEIPPAFQEKYASLLELTDRVGTGQKGMYVLVQQRYTLTH